MATATNAVHPVHPDAVLDEGRTVQDADERPVIPPQVPAPATRPARESEYRCECGQSLRVFGVGRHRVYFEPGPTQLDAPVMDRACPACGHGLPGKNPL